MSESVRREAPLVGVTVLEIGAGVAAAYCGKLFIDMGARVHRLEPAGGLPLRCNGVRYPVRGLAPFFLTR